MDARGVGNARVIFFPATFAVGPPAAVVQSFAPTHPTTTTNISFSFWISASGATRGAAAMSLPPQPPAGHPNSVKEQVKYKYLRAWVGFGCGDLVGFHITQSMVFPTIICTIYPCDSSEPS